MAIWYIGSTKYAAISTWAASTAYTVGALRRQTSPTAGNERVFICIVAGTSGGSEPTWVLTKGAKTTDNTVTWMEVTGNVALNGNLAATSNWTVVKNTSVALGRIIQRNSGGSLQICTTAGTAGNGSEPSFSNTAGTTTADGGTLVWTSLGDPSNYGAFAAPMQSLSLALNATTHVAAGDTCYVSNHHAQTNSSGLAYTSNNSTASGLIYFYCIDDTSGTPSAPTTGATVSTTGASDIQFNAHAYFYGIGFSSGDGANTASILPGSGSSGGTMFFEQCSFALGNTSTSSVINLSGQATSAVGSFCVYKDCTLTFGATGQKVQLMAKTDFIGGSIAATGSVPTTLFTLPRGCPFVNFRDVDISAVTGTLFANTNTSIASATIKMSNCKLGSGVTIYATQSETFCPQVSVVNCDSATTNYRYFFGTYWGNVIQETSITRLGGATDKTTAFSWNMTTNANAKFNWGLVSEEFFGFQDTTGSSKTATVEITTDATLTNADCWLELEYPSSSGAPLGAVVTTRMTPLGTPAALTSSSATWNGTAKANKYKLQAAFTPQAKGAIKARVVVCQASATVYVDPVITVS